MSDALSIYLQDHLGGAKFAVELLQAWQDDREQPEEFRTFAADLKQQVEEDRIILERLVSRLGKPSHSLKEAAGWLAEKASRYKLAHRSDKAFARHEGLETLALGIMGKLSLWNALHALSLPPLPNIDLEQLAQSARAQYDRVETRRIAGVRDAFASESAQNKS